MGRTAPLTSKRFILYIYSTNIGTEYFKHALYSPFFYFQNAVCFIMLTCLVPVLFTFRLQDVLKLKKNNSGAKELMIFRVYHLPLLFFVLQSAVEMRQTSLCISSSEPRLESDGYATFFYSFVRARSPNTVKDSPGNLCNNGGSRRQRFLKEVNNAVIFLKLPFYNILNYCADN